MSAQAQPIISVGWVPAPSLFYASHPSPRESFRFVLLEPFADDRVPLPANAEPPRAARTEGTRIKDERGRSDRRRSEKREREREQKASRTEKKGKGREKMVPRRREKWQTLSCHEALDVFILPQAVLRERRIRYALSSVLSSWT